MTNTQILKILNKSETCLIKSSDRWELELINLCKDKNEYIRANAILSFGILTRRFKKLNNLEIVNNIINNALENDTNFVKGSADAAKDDIELFIKN
jgi:hypothetical protein